MGPTWKCINAVAWKGVTVKSLLTPLTLRLSSTVPRCRFQLSLRGCFATQNLAAYSSR